MENTSTMIDPGVWDEIMKNAKFRSIPELPRYTWTVGKDEFFVTDLFYLNNYARVSVGNILRNMMNNKDTDEVRLNFPAQTLQSDIYATCDILFAFSCGWKTTEGKTLKEIDRIPFVDGVRPIRNDDDSTTLCVHVRKDIANVIYNYCNNVGKKEYSEMDIVPVVVEHEKKSFFNVWEGAND